MTESLDWIAAQLDCPPSEVEIEAVPGDASSRRYFRVRGRAGTWVFSDSPPDSNNNVGFVDVARRLQEGGIAVPAIKSYDPERGWFLMEDFGDTLYRELLTPENGTELMPTLLDVLERMATQVSADGLPVFSDALIQEELDMFPEWFLGKQLGTTFTSQEEENWQALCTLLKQNAAAQPQVFVHRDIHSCNLMWREGASPGVIDFQDAAKGPITYDLISLIWDRYITWPRKQVEHWLEAFRNRVGDPADRRTWLRWCDLMGLQRHLKVVGIFARLAYRDDKLHYLDLQPRFAEYAMDVLSRYEELAAYEALLRLSLQIVHVAKNR